MHARLVALFLLCLLTAGCEQLGIETPAVTYARLQADSKAVGGACRNAGRAIEDCYAMNKKADRASVFTGWREMSEYMLENKLEPVIPTYKPEPAPPPPAPPQAAKADEHEAEADEPEPTKGKGKGKVRAAKPAH